MRELRALVGTRLLLLPGVSAIIRNNRGDVLCLLRADDGRWGLPAGAIDPGESPAAAIVREVREETGLDVCVEAVAGVFGGTDFRHQYPNGDEAEFVTIVFECRVTGGKLHAADGEALEFRWFPFNAMPHLGLRYPPELFSPDRRTPLTN